MDAKRVKLAMSDAAARADLVRLIEGIPGWVLETGPETPCDLLVCEITKENAKHDFDLVNSMIAVSQTRNVFLVSGLADQDFIRQALRLGAKELFPLPLDPEDVRQAFLKFQNGNGAGSTEPAKAPEKQGTVMYIMGSKGGVGTTTIAVNLAASLAGSPTEPRVALVDMNLLFGDIPVFLGIQSYDFDWAEIVNNIGRLDRSFLAGTLHKHRSGIQVLPSPASILKSTASGPEVMAKLFRVMKTMFDYVIIDGGQGIGDMSKGILGLADKVFIVTLLNLPCLINVKRLRDAFDQLGYPPDGRVEIVANRAFRKSAAIPMEDAERTLKKKILWTVPNDFQNAMASINMGKTLNEIASSSEINTRISELARLLQEGSPAEAGRKKGFFGRVFSK